MKFYNIDDEIDYTFICDSQAFCFWGYPQKWTIEYQDKKLDGWWALMACVQRAIENGVPMGNGAYLSALNNKSAGEIFRGNPEIPLLKERVEILRGIGLVLEAKFQSRFSHFLKISPHEALNLMLQIVEQFPGFNDQAKYKGRNVYFYKKAQLLVEDLNRILQKYRQTPIPGMENLTSEADYKIPALLRDLGILKYSTKFAHKVDQRVELPQGSAEEVEIRAGMLWAVHLLVKELTPRYPDLTATTLDRELWHLSQDKSRMIHPYHLTKTVYY
jgi:hypothetical protein